jgi:hypothetical protein
MSSDFTVHDTGTDPPGTRLVRSGVPAQSAVEGIGEATRAAPRGEISLIAGPARNDSGAEDGLRGRQDSDTRTAKPEVWTPRGGFFVFSFDPKGVVEVAIETLRETLLQTAPRISLRIVMRIGREVEFPTAASVGLRVPHQRGPEAALQVGRRIAGRNYPPTSARTRS